MPGRENNEFSCVYTKPLKLVNGLRRVLLNLKPFQVEQQNNTESRFEIRDRGWVLKRSEKGADFVFTRHRQGFRFHLAPFRNRFQIARLRLCAHGVVFVASSFDF